MANEPVNPVSGRSIFGDIAALVEPRSPAPLVPASITAHNPAEWMHERVVRSINDFEKDLNRDQEVGARLVSFGIELTFHIEDVGFWGPDMIIFYGVDRHQKRVELLQHISQLSVLLVAMDKEQEEPRRIGFKMVQELDASKDETKKR